MESALASAARHAAATGLLRGFRDVRAAPTSATPPQNATPLCENSRSGAVQLLISRKNTKIRPKHAPRRSRRRTEPPEEEEGGSKPHS